MCRVVNSLTHKNSQAENCRSTCVVCVCVYEKVWQEHVVPFRKGKEHSQQAERERNILYTYSDSSSSNTKLECWPPRRSKASLKHACNEAFHTYHMTQPSFHHSTTPRFILCPGTVRPTVKTRPVLCPTTRIQDAICHQSV